MAENTYRKKKAEEEKGNPEKPEKRNKKLKKERVPEPEEENDEVEEGRIEKLIRDKRVHIISGLSIIVFSVCLVLAFISFLFSGSADQTIVEGLFSTSVRESGKEVENVLGVFGAFVSYVFIYKGFGLAAFLFIPLFFLIGFKLAFKKDLLPFFSVFRNSIFFILWISVCLGFFVFKINSDSIDLSFLCGAVGYELAALSDAIIGWATPFLLLVFLVGFAIFFFNITQISRSGDMVEQKLDEISEDTQENLDAVVDELSEEAEMIEEAQEDELNEELLPEEELEEEEIDISEWKEISKSDTKKSKTTEKPDLEFKIENSEDLLDPKQTETNGTNIPQIIVEDTITTPKEEDVEKEFSEPIENYDPTLDLPKYQYPTLDLLNEYEHSKAQVTREELEANKDRIVDTLKNYNIGISSIKATIGPTVTLYEIVPEAGIRISKIKTLEDDIALSLSALGIRIIAPMPGKGTIGIEVPNKNKEMVSIRSILSTERFQLSDMDLPVAFGKTISNEIFIIDLAKMPHLLMAGATGQGKSVGLNVLLTSLLYKKHPSQLKFVLVDPKKVELSIFNKIERHFLAKLPNTEEAIITDTKKVIHTLNSLCIEMDTRYDLLKEAGCRNLKEYNRKFVERKLNPNNGHRFLPYIVLVIDELADLMMTAGKEVETPIARLAQLARAIGIHLVVATQRPSVNVITGIIKANFPARLSFKVTSKIDSRTILDASGSEQLIGQGDMLFSQGSEVIRLQCAFIDTPEVDRISSFIGEQRGYPNAYQLPEYTDDDMEGEGEEIDLSERDKLFDEAARLIVAAQQGSTSLIQRRLKLGYNRAGRLIDQLEAAGVVGPFEGSKAREVLIKDPVSLEQLLNKLNEKS